MNIQKKVDKLIEKSKSWKEVINELSVDEITEWWIECDKLTKSK